MDEKKPLTIITCHVRGVAPTDRNFLGGTIQNYLEKIQCIDLRIKWNDGDSDTKDVKISVEAEGQLFDAIREGIRDSLAPTYLANPAIDSKAAPVAKAA